MLSKHLFVFFPRNFEKYVVGIVPDVRFFQLNNTIFFLNTSNFIYITVDGREYSATLLEFKFINIHQGS